MTGFEEEIRSWSDAWRSTEPTVVPDAATLRRQVMRRTTRFRAAVVLEIIVLGSMLMWLLSFGIASSDPYDRAMVAAFVVLIIACFLRGAQVVRQTWRPRAETTREFIDLMIRRGEIMLLQLRLGWAILAFEIAVFVPWIHHTLTAPGRPQGPVSGFFAWGLLALLAGGAAAWIIFARRRSMADLKLWLALRSRMSE